MLVNSWSAMKNKNSSDLWRKYMCIEFVVDVRKQFLKSKHIKKKGAATKVVKLKYERLGIFCFCCGLLGHTKESRNKVFFIY